MLGTHQAENEELARVEPLIARKNFASSLLSPESKPATSNAYGKLSAFVLIYILLGTLTFSLVNSGFNVLNAGYFSITTLTTVGYGDIEPSNDTGRVIFMFYASIGLIFFGYVLTNFGNKVVERQRKVVERVQQNASTRIITAMSPESDDDSDEGVAEMVVEKFVEVLTPRFPLLLMIYAVGLIIGHFEQWSVISSLYFSFVTSTTIGFGDFTPKTWEMKIVALFYIPLSVCIMAETLGAMANAYIEYETEQAEKDFLTRELVEGDLCHMDMDEDKRVTKSDFIVFVLQAMNKVDTDTVDRITEAFHRLDKNDNGYLDKGDVIKKTRSAIFTDSPSQTP